MNEKQSRPPERLLRLVSAILIVGAACSVSLFAFGHVLLAILAIALGFAVECAVIVIALFGGGGTGAPPKARAQQQKREHRGPDESLDTSIWAPRG